MKTILIVTGTRAEYGILKSIMSSIIDHPGMILKLIATGMHLSHEFGYTVEEIEKDGFTVDLRVDMLLDEDSKASMAKSLGQGIIGMTDAIEKAKPDVVMVCGDRGEAFAATLAAAFLSIPVAHVFGGSAAIGSNIDDSIRNAITKFAHIHFTATNQHAEDIINMGEDKWRVHVTGSPSIDSILGERLIKPEDLAKKYSLDHKSDSILVIQHPTSIDADSAGHEMKQTLAAVAELGIQTIVIYPNSDAGSREMIKVIETYENKFSNIYAIKNMPYVDYLSLMNMVTVMVGNSSSGIFEAPSFKLPVVNIGIRQKGRAQAGNVINIEEFDKDEIKNTISGLVSNNELRSKLRECKNPYGDGNASGRIVEILNDLAIDKKLLQKK